MAGEVIDGRFPMDTGALLFSRAHRTALRMCRTPGVALPDSGGGERISRLSITADCRTWV